MASTTVVTTASKSLLGENSLNLDFAGTGETFPVPTSKQNEFRNDRKISANTIPTLTTARSKTLITGSTSTADTINEALVELYDGIVLALPLAGGTMTGNVDFGTNNITNLGQLSMQSGGSGVDMNNTGITDAGASNFTGAVAMGSNKITGMATGTASGDGLHAGQIDTDHLELNGSNNLSIKADGVGITELNMDNAGGTFGLFIVSGVKATLSGGATTETVTGFTGLESTDLFIATFNTNLATVKTLRKVSYVSATSVEVGSETGNFVSGDIISIIALRATVAI